MTKNYYVKGIALPACLGLAFACSAPETSTVKARIDADSSDFDLGRGVDLVSEKPMGNCVDVQSIKPIFNASGKEINFSLTKVTSSQELMKSLSVKAKAKYSAGVGSAKGKASFTDEVSINSQSLFLLINVKVTNPTLTLDNPKLRPEAANVLISRGKEAFRKACGDEFVRSQVTGAEFAAVLEIQTSDESHKQAIDASLKGSYGAASGSASFSSRLEEIVKNNKTQVYVYQSGGSAEKIDISADGLINIATEFPAKVNAENARPIDAFTASYENLLNFPAGANIIDVTQQSDNLLRLAQYDLDISDLLASIDYALKNRDQYQDLDVADLNLSANTFRTNLNTIRRAASACASNYQLCELPTFAFPELVLPPRKLPTSIVEKPSVFASKAEYLVFKAYRECLGRAPESDAVLKAWAQHAVVNGVDAMRGGICNSPEAQLEGTQRLAVTAAYQDCLGRMPESDFVISNWRGELLHRGVDSMRKGICSSVEAQTLSARQNAVNFAYGRCLKTAPATAGESNFWSELAGVSGIQNAIDGICGGKNS